MMNPQRTRKLAGALLILGAVLVNVPYALLIATFDYPDVLRLPPGELLTRFAAGGPRLIWTWLAFAWVGLPILVGILLIPQGLASDPPEGRRPVLGQLALAFGAVGAIAQMLGLLRWPLVVPLMARAYTAPQATAATREAVAVVFQAVHQYGGVVLGEHIGQAFTILWMILLGLDLLPREAFPRWLSWAGFAAAGVYAMAQGELLATAIPGLRYWGAAGLVGSLLWLGWLIALGVVLIRPKRSRSYEHTGPGSRVSVGAVQ